MLFGPSRCRAALVALSLVRRARVVVVALAFVPVLMLSPATAAAAIHAQATIASPIETNVWLATATGKVYAFGSTASYGSVDSPLNKPIVGIAADPGRRRVLVGRLRRWRLRFGDAKFFGSTGSDPVNKPMVGMAADPDGSGYWLVASDGGVFAR